MDFLTDRIKPIYFKYLSASFGTAMIASIYSIVDVAMVGQYQGPEGTAALAVVAPAWNIIYSLGLLMGAGGSVLFSIRLGGETGDGRERSGGDCRIIRQPVAEFLQKRLYERAGVRHQIDGIYSGNCRSTDG